MATLTGTSVVFVGLGQAEASSTSPTGVSRQIVVETDQSEFILGVSPTHIPLSFQRTVGYNGVGSIGWQFNCSGFLVEDGFLSTVADAQDLGEDYKGILYITYSNSASTYKIKFNACLASVTAEKTGLEAARVNLTFYGYDELITFTQA